MGFGNLIIQLGSKNLECVINIKDANVLVINLQVDENYTNQSYYCGPQ